MDYFEDTLAWTFITTFIIIMACAVPPAVVGSVALTKHFLTFI